LPFLPPSEPFHLLLLMLGLWTPLLEASMMTTMMTMALMHPTTLLLSRDHQSSSDGEHHFFSFTAFATDCECR
jgi:hypothetical protein